MLRQSSLSELLVNQMLRRLARFCVVGVSGVGVNMGLLILLTDAFGIPYVVSSVAAIEMSILSNFALNNIWTWSDRRTTPLRQRLIKYHSVAGVTGMAANWSLLLFLTNVVGLDYRLSNLIGIASGVLLNFVLNHVWTFRRHAGEAVQPLEKADALLAGTSAQDPHPTEVEKMAGVSVPTRASRERLLWFVIAVLIVLTIAKLWFAAHAELLPEEAYYWTYLQHPALSYFDHPPMVAWVIGAGTWLWGDCELGVRFGTILLSLGSSFWLFVLARLWFGQTCAYWAVLLFNLLPIFVATGLVAFPDGPLVFFWLLTLFAVSKGLGVGAPKSPAHRETRATPYWLLAGMAFGGALLSKYTAIMLAASLGFFLFISCTHRQWLLRPQLWLAGVVALLAFSPVIVWNAQHEWASFLFQSTRRVAQRPEGLINVLLFWLAQLAILGPIPLALLGLTAFRGVHRGWFKREEPWSFILAFFLPLFAVFVLASFKTEVHLNWTAPAFLSLILGAAAIFHEGIDNKLRLRACYWRAGAWLVAAFGIAAIGVATITMISGAPQAWNYAHVGGWRQLATVVNTAKAELERMTGSRAFVLGADKYNTAAELGFYTGEPENHVNRLALGKTGLGFRYWTDLNQFEGRPAVAVLKSPDESILSDLRAHFDRVDSPRRFDVPATGGRVRTAWLLDCYGYRRTGRK
jgi:dolichol-phosphate mannosyltransferase